MFTPSTGTSSVMAEPTARSSIPSPPRLTRRSAPAALTVPSAWVAETAWCPRALSHDDARAASSAAWGRSGWAKNAITAIEHPSWPFASDHGQILGQGRSLGLPVGGGHGCVEHLVDVSGVAAGVSPGVDQKFDVAGMTGDGRRHRSPDRGADLCQRAA